MGGVRHPSRLESNPSCRGALKTEGWTIASQPSESRRANSPWKIAGKPSTAGARFAYVVSNKHSALVPWKAGSNTPNFHAFLPRAHS